MNKLYIVGVGPGAKDYILPEAMKRIQEADVLVGGKRNLESFDFFCKDKFIIGNNLEEVCRYIKDNVGDKKIVVIVTGDPGLFSILNYLQDKLQGVSVSVVPGISSMQYLCCKKNISWDDMAIISLHGRDNPGFISRVRSNAKLAVFTGGGNKPEDICKLLISNNLSDIRVTVGENLTYENERIITGTPEELSKRSFDELSIMLLENQGKHEKTDAFWEFRNSSIPDELFIRGDVPMTKEEVRAVSMSKLRLKEDSVVYDIGAGTGSVSIECGLRCSSGKVFAVEKNSKAVELIYENAGKFGLNNIVVVCGEAPEVLKDLPEPDRVFIGGSSGNMESILEWVSKSSKEVRIVINTVTLESTGEALKGLEVKGLEEIEIVNVSIARGKQLGGKHLMQALNPVYVISAMKRGRKP